MFADLEVILANVLAHGNDGEYQAGNEDHVDQLVSKTQGNLR